MYFPSWRYHRDGRQQLINTIEEHEELLRDGWVDRLPVGEDLEEPKAGADSVEEPETVSVIDYRYSDMPVVEIPAPVVKRGRKK